MSDQCTPGLPGSLVESIGLAIELVGDQVKHSPERLAAILNSPEVQKKIKEALEKRLGELQKKALEGRPIDSTQALQEVQAVFTTDSFDVIAKEAKKSLEQSSKFRQLKDSLEGLACEFKERPLGAFYDEAGGVLIVLAVGAMIAGIAGIYIIETGDKDRPLGLVSKLAEAIVIPVGKVEVGLTDVVLKPSEKKYDAGLLLKIENWKAIKSAQLKVVVQTKDEKVAALPISVETKVRIAPGWFNTFGATFEPRHRNATFALGIQGGTDSLSVQVKATLSKEDKKFMYGGSGTVNWTPFPGTPLDITGGVGVNRIDQTVLDPRTNVNVRTQQTDLNVNLGLKVHF